MNRSHTAYVPPHFARYQDMIVDDVVPTPTMQLHRRLFSWSRRKHIPIKDEDAGQLNAYLINPAYLDKNVVKHNEYVKSQNRFSMIQYSQLARPYENGASIVKQAPRLYYNLQESLNRLPRLLSSLFRNISLKSWNVGRTSTRYEIKRGARQPISYRFVSYGAIFLTLGVGAALLAQPDEAQTPWVAQDTTTSSVVTNTQNAQSNRGPVAPDNIPLFDEPAGSISSSRVLPVIANTTQDQSSNIPVANNVVTPPNQISSPSAENTTQTLSPESSGESSAVAESQPTEPTSDESPSTVIDNTVDTVTDITTDTVSELTSTLGL